MQPHPTLYLSGFFTQAKYVRGRSLGELERILGFHKGRFAKGVKIAALNLLPRNDSFALRGYSQVAGHHYDARYGADADKLDLEKLKRMAALHWTLGGPNRLIKVLPNVRHSELMEPDEQYPPGLGVPQWELTRKWPLTILAEVSDYPNGKLLW